MELTNKKILFERKDAGVNSNIHPYLEINAKEHKEEIKEGIEIKSDNISIVASTRIGDYDLDIIHPRIPDLNCYAFNSEKVGDGKINAEDASLILQIASTVAKDCRGHNVGFLEIKDKNMNVVFERKMVDLDRLEEDWGIDFTKSPYAEYTKIIEPIFNRKQTWRADASWNSFENIFLPITIRDAILVNNYAAYRGAGEPLVINFEDTSEKDWGKFLKLVDERELSLKAEVIPFSYFFPAVIDMSKITKEDYDIIKIAYEQKQNGIAFEDCILAQYKVNPKWEEHYNNGNILKTKIYNFDLIKHFLGLCEMKTLMKPQGYYTDEDGKPYGTPQGWKDYIEREFGTLSAINIENIEFIFTDKDNYSEKSISPFGENNQISSVISDTSYNVKGVGGIEIISELGGNVQNTAEKNGEIKLSLSQLHDYSEDLGELLSPINYQLDISEESGLQSQYYLYPESPSYYFRGKYNYEYDENTNTLISQNIEIKNDDKAIITVNMPSLQSQITNEVEVIDPLPKLRSFSLYVKNNNNEWVTPGGINQRQTTGTDNAGIPIMKQNDIIGRPLYLNSGNEKGIISYHIDRLGRFSNELIESGRQYYHTNETPFNPTTEEYLKIELAFNGIPNEDYKLPQVDNYTSNNSEIYWSCQLNNLKLNNTIEIIEAGLENDIVPKEVSPKGFYTTTGREIVFYCIVKIKGNIDNSPITQEGSMSITDYYDYSYRDNLYSQIAYPLVFTFRHDTEESPNGEIINFGEKIYIDLLLQKKEV